jgi:hypothetical protein
MSDGFFGSFGQAGLRRGIYSKAAKQDSRLRCAPGSLSLSTIRHHHNKGLMATSSITSVWPPCFAHSCPLSKQAPKQFPTIDPDTAKPEAPPHGIDVTARNVLGSLHPCLHRKMNISVLSRGRWYTAI